MAGATERCFFCADSRGADIDHYLPVNPNYGSTFDWSNLLLVCTPCNRQKSKQAPHRGGARVLLDPTRDDPWDHLIYVSQTGLLAPRFGAGGDADVMGEETLAMLSVLNHDAIAVGRLRAVRRLRVAAERAVAEGDLPHTRQAALESLVDDSYGLAVWFTAREGRHEHPFVTLAQSKPALWRRLCSAAGRR